MDYAPKLYVESYNHSRIEGVWKVKKKKLLIVIKNIDGGTGTFLFQLLKLQNEFEIKVCALERRRFGAETSKKFYYFSKKLLYRGHYNLNPFLGLGIAKEFLWLAKIVRQENPDFILSIDTHSNILASAVSLFARSKLILTTHNNLSSVVNRKLVFPLRYILRILGTKLFKRADEIVCVSEGVGEDFRKFFSVKKRINIISYGLNRDDIKNLETKKIPIRYRKIFSSKYKIILSIGRFEEQKDFTSIINSFAHAYAENNLFRLVLIGDGGERRMLEELVARLKISDAVFFLGWQSNVYPFIKRSDLFILASKYEGFGYVLLEAMSQGVPVISTDSPFGPREVLEDGKWGVLVPVGDVKQLNKAIKKILNDRSEQKKYSEKSKLRIKDYTEEKMIERYKCLLRFLNN